MFPVFRLPGPKCSEFCLFYNVKRYTIIYMIKGFGDKKTRKLFDREPPRGIAENIHRIAFRKLRMIHRATILDDLRIPPGNHLELLEGARKGNIVFALTINGGFVSCGGTVMRTM